MSYNNTVLVGNLCRDIEIRQTASGDSVGSTSIAVNGYKEGEVMFMPVTIWGKLADSAANALGKGSRVLVAGRLKQNNWEKDGETKSRIELNANTVQFLDPKGSKPSGGDPAAGAVDEDNLPF